MIIPEISITLLSNRELEIIVAGESQREIEEGDQEEIVLEQREAEVYVESEETRTIKNTRTKGARTNPVLTTEIRLITPKLEVINNGF